MARPIMIIQSGPGRSADLATICVSSAFRFHTFCHSRPEHDAALIKRLASVEGDILIDRDVRLGGEAIEAIRARLGRGDPPTQLALLPRLSIRQKLPDFIGGLFEQVRWESAQKAYEIGVDRANCAPVFTDPCGDVWPLTVDRRLSLLEKRSHPPVPIAKVVREELDRFGLIYRNGGGDA